MVAWNTPRGVVDRGAAAAALKRMAVNGHLTAELTHTVSVHNTDRFTVTVTSADACGRAATREDAGRSMGDAHHAARASFVQSYITSLRECGSSAMIRRCIYSQPVRGSIQLPS